MTPTAEDDTNLTNVTGTPNQIYTSVNWSIKSELTYQNVILKLVVRPLLITNSVWVKQVLQIAEILNFDFDQLHKPRNTANS